MKERQPGHNWSVQSPIGLRTTPGRTGLTALPPSTFPSLSNCPAAISAAFSWGSFGQPLRHAPRSLNVVSISRCMSEGGWWRRGEWFVAGKSKYEKSGEFTLCLGLKGNEAMETIGLHRQGVNPPEPPSLINRQGSDEPEVHL